MTSATAASVHDTDPLPRASSAWDYMAEPVYSVSCDASAREVDRALEERDVSAVVVEDVNGDPVGVVSRSDLVRVAYHEELAPPRLVLSLPDKRAGEVMTKGIVTLPPEAPIEAVARTMADRGIARVFVSRENLLLGVVGAVEILRAVADRRIPTPLARAMSRPFLTVEADEGLAVAAQRVAGAGMHGLVVVEDGWPVGVVGDSEVLLARRWPPHVPVRDWMQPRVLCLPAGMPLFRAASHALHNDVRHVIVMDDRGMKGIITGIDFARSLAVWDARAECCIEERKHHVA